LQTSYYGEIFERWIIAEIYKLISYKENDYSLSYLRTKDNAEIDLIIERPGLPKALVEIKSTNQITENHLQSLKKFALDLPDAEAFCLSQDPYPKKYGKISALHWKEGLIELGL
jgi:predicted AAA+ superfamily ATPase